METTHGKESLSLEAHRKLFIVQHTRQQRQFMLTIMSSLLLALPQIVHILFQQRKQNFAVVSDVRGN